MSTPTQYKTLEEIQLRKAMLLTDIQKTESQMKKDWHSLFHKPEALKKGALPAKRFGSLVNVGAGAIDAFLLGWKLYRKFKK
jgi:hypothetical protein